MTGKGPGPIDRPQTLHDQKRNQAAARSPALSARASIGKDAFPAQSVPSEVTGSGSAVGSVQAALRATPADRSGPRYSETIIPRLRSLRPLSHEVLTSPSAGSTAGPDPGVFMEESEHANPIIDRTEERFEIGPQAGSEITRTLTPSKIWLTRKASLNHPSSARSTARYRRSCTPPRRRSVRLPPGRLAAAATSYRWSPSDRS
jgi:hypothetical protein